MILLSLGLVSTVWNEILTVVAGAGSPAIPVLNVNGQSGAGVTQMERINNNATCLSSTLTFSGSLEDLSLLNSATLFCGVVAAQVSTSISVPGKMLGKRALVSSSGFCANKP